MTAGADDSLKFVAVIFPALMVVGAPRERDLQFAAARPSSRPGMQHLLFHTVTPGIGIYQQLLTRLGGSAPAPAVVRPPGHLADLEVGGPRLQVTRECSVSGATIHFDVMRASERPACFHLSGLLSQAECEQLAQEADAQGSAQATTFGGAVTSAWRSGCDVAWLRVDGGTPASIAACCERLLLTPQAESAGRFENLQVQRPTMPTLSLSLRLRLSLSLSLTLILTLTHAPGAAVRRGWRVPAALRRQRAIAPRADGAVTLTLTLTLALTLTLKP